MTSFQHTVGSKAEKFTEALSEEQASVRAAMHEEVDKRMNRAMDDLKEKYESGKRSRETSVNAPTGAAYRAAAAAAAKTEASRPEEAPQPQALQEDDAELRALRERRLRELKDKQNEKLENLHKGHGKYEEIVQDEFLREVLKSKRVLCHFYHDEFEDCKIMDHHLGLLAPRHVETRFLKLNAAKAPFFVAKLQIRVMPTVVGFLDGQAVAFLRGFDGLTQGLEEGHENEFHTSALATWLSTAGILDDLHHESTPTTTLAAARAAALAAAVVDDDLEDDWED